LTKLGDLKYTNYEITNKENGMVDILDIIISRRSIKKYKSDMVERDKIDRVIKAGMYAPSGRNRQAGTIIAITNKNVRDRLSQLLAESRGVDIDPFYNAPVVLAVVVDKSVNTAIYDGACIIENMLLEAHSIGLGACWVHHAKEIFQTEFGKSIIANLGISSDIEGVGFCILGYSDMEVHGELPRKNDYVYYID
jgi:nitroreductase